MHKIPQREAHGPADTQAERFGREGFPRVEPVQIACVVTRPYLFDFMILCESVRFTWTYPVEIHAFVSDEILADEISAMGLPDVSIHPQDGADGGRDWQANALRKIELVEQSGLDRCIVSDADNVFLSETPELFLLLDRVDFAFVESPNEEGPLQPSLWSFRSNERSVGLARTWLERLQADASTDAGSLPFTVADSREHDVAISVVGRAGDGVLPPYNMQLNSGVCTWLRRDLLGFSDERMGRAKVVHLGGLGVERSESLDTRIKAFVERFPHAVEFLPFYSQLANRAARKLGMEAAEDPPRLVSRHLHRAGILPSRQELPQLLNERGLVGRGAEIGVLEGRFSAQILSSWSGRNLLSIDPWRGNDARYERVCRRLGAFGERSTIWRMMSVDAAAQLPDHSLDFVYIDAMHDYDSVKEDLEAWYGKVRPGGILAGHDYQDEDLPHEVCRVKSAVDEFFASLGKPVRATFQDVPFLSWIVEV
jgi:hypothetical protein